MSKAIGRIHKKKVPGHSGALNIPTYTGSEFINYEDIVFLEAEDSYTSIYLRDSKILSTKNIGEYEAMLMDHSFFRTHHSFIVNMAQIEKFNKGRSGILFMKTGHTIPVSQRKMKEFAAWIKTTF